MTVQGAMAGIGPIILTAILLGISLGFAIPIGISASRRGMNAVGWGVFAFFTWFTGLIVFLLFAKPKTDDMACSACGQRIPRNHVYCPFCGHRESIELHYQ